MLRQLLPLLLLLACACASSRRSRPRPVPPLVEEVAGLLEKHHYAHPPRKQLLDAWQTLPEDAPVSALLARTVDRATRLLSADEAKALFADVLGQDGTGLGLPELLSVDLDERTGQLTVVTPLPDSPAARADLRPGDVLLRIGQEETAALSLSEAARRLRGAATSSVQLTVQRGRGAPRTLQLVREVAAPTPAVQLRVLERPEGLTGYLRLTHFPEQAAAELALALQTLQQREVRRAVLDLRHNPGGSVEAAGACAGLLAGPLLVAQLPGAPTDSATVTSADTARYDGALVVLVNEGTASAAEMLAGALQAKGRAKLVGTRTFGKGLVHLPLPLSSGETLLVSIARAHTPTGRDILAQGLAPDVAAPTPERPWSLHTVADAVPDSQLEAALRLLP
jgi:carboxyl-terminal processing protease